MSIESEAASKAVRRVRRANQATARANRVAYIANRAPGTTKGRATNDFLATQPANRGGLPLFGRGSRAPRATRQLASATRIRALQARRRNLANRTPRAINGFNAPSPGITGSLFGRGTRSR
ncbi:MAG: hypothetical protein ACAF41_12560 [Leptolyngbya sp. BL-A-14]